MKRALTCCFLLSLIACVCAAAARAQEAGDFTVRYGVTARDRPRDEQAGRANQRGTFTFGVNITPRVSFGLNTNTFITRKGADGVRATAYGDTFLNLDGVLVEEVIGAARPSVSLSYTIKLPTGDKAKRLSSGRVDHQVLITMRKTVGESQRSGVDVSFGGYFAGRRDTSSFTQSGQLALGYDRKLGEEKRYKFRTEVNLSGRAETLPSEIYANNWLQYKVNQKVSVRGGLRNGVTVNSARVGLFGTIIFSGNFGKIF